METFTILHMKHILEAQMRQKLSASVFMMSEHSTVDTTNFSKASCRVTLEQQSKRFKHIRSTSSRFKYLTIEARASFSDDKSKSMIN